MRANIQVFWDVMSCLLVNSYCCFKETECLHLQGLIVQEHLASQTLKMGGSIILQNIGNYLPIDIG